VHGSNESDQTTCEQPFMNAVADDTTHLAVSSTAAPLMSQIETRAP
jgi:hypothetical protein